MVTGTRPRTRRAGTVAVGVAAALALVGCASVTPERGPEATRETSQRAPDATEAYLPGLDADVHLPAGSPRSAAVVVMVPGGGWTSADRSGLSGLAADLAAAGSVVVNATYRVAPAARFPLPVADVVCAADFGAARAARAGVSPTRVVLLGHSAGAQLAALAALAPSRFRDRCPWPARDVDGLVGLAGPYDPEAMSDVVEPLFGATREESPGPWREGTPSTWAGSRTPPPPVLLVHGEDDDVVPVGQSRDFAAVLSSAGHAVDVHVVPGADHHTIYQPEVVSAIVQRWLDTLG